LNEDRLSIKLKTQAVKLGLGLFHLFRYSWRAAFFIVVFGFGRPLAWFGRSVLFRALVPVYRRYHQLKQRLEGFFAASRNSWIYPFTTRYLIHVVVVLITFAVAANSVFARETKVEEFGSRTLLSTFFQDGGVEADTVEYALPAPQVELSALTREGTVDRYHRTDVDADTNQRAYLAIVRQETNGEVVAKAASPVTDAAGTPRSSIVEYSVQGGETLGLIAERYGISANTLRWANGLDDRALIKPGQILKVPPTSGVLHTVASGDTIEKIAQKYHTDATGILDYNRLANASAIDVGSQLVIPGGKIDPPKAPIVPRVPSSSGNDSGPRPANARNVGTGLFWPTPSHRINQGYSYRHGGIDIDSDRSPIYASAAGRVVRTNWGRGYGNNIIIDHGNGLTTLYAHLSKSFVGVGESIEKGETIGISGCTGWCTGDHLHFEVWISGQRTNPFNYL
jgi:murein DD-endopeptidase MepM/ murein hydrolase activator NlpD